MAVVRVILAGDNLVPDATLTGADDLDVLKNYRLDKVWSQAGANTVVVAFSAASQVDTIAVGGVSEGSTIHAWATGQQHLFGRILMRATGTVWNPPSGHLHILTLDEAVTIPSLSLRFNTRASASLADQHRDRTNNNLRAAWIYAGKRIRTRAGIVDDFSHEVELGPGNRRERLLSLHWPILFKSEASALRGLSLRHGMETPLLVVPRDVDTDLWAEEAMLGRIVGRPMFRPWREAGRNKRMTATMSFQEVIA